MEILHNNEWAFALDMNDPKFFLQQRKMKSKFFIEEPSYTKFWEHNNFRQYSSIDSDKPIPQEYEAIKRILVNRIPQNIFKENDNSQGILECSEELKIEPKPDIAGIKIITPVNSPKINKKAKQTSNGKKKANNKKIPETLQLIQIKQKIKKPSGMKNMGNSCFLLSSIQCLKHTGLLWDYFETNQYERDINLNSKGEIVKSLANLMHSLREDNQCISPHEFKKVIASYSTQFSGNDQSDAHEFLTFLIDKLHEELKFPTSDPAKSAIGDCIDERSQYFAYESKIKDIFYGIYNSTIACTKCLHVSHNKEPFMCISLPIEGNIDEITFFIYLQTHHLLILKCKHDDENINFANIKQEIQQKLIVGILDIYLLPENGQLEIIDDLQTIGQVSKRTSPWQLYAIERSSDDSESLVKANISKKCPQLLLSCPKNVRDNPTELNELIRKLLMGAAVDEHNKISKGQSEALNLTEIKKEEIFFQGNIKYTEIEFKPAGKNSDLKQLWAKLPQKNLDIIKHKTEENYGELQSCLIKFTNTEKLQGNNQWICPVCREFTDANKKIEYGQLPKILIIQLKRFKVIGKQTRIKIATLVNFPLILLLNTADGETHMYKLYAVLNHIGGIEGGHYTAYCRNLNNRNEWLEFDDTKVKVIDSTQFATNKAYVLFYENT